MKRRETSRRKIGGHKPRKYKLKFETINLKNQKDCMIFKHLTYFSVGCLVASTLAKEIIGFLVSSYLILSFSSLHYLYTHKSEIYFEEVRVTEDSR